MLADYYRPEPPLACPINGRPFDLWEGFAGRGNWLVFKEGCGHPVDTLRGRVSQHPRLPDGRHSIFGEVQGVRAIAHIHVKNGVWTETVLTDCDGAEPVHLAGDFFLWPVPQGRACISGLRPDPSRLVPAPVIIVGVSPGCIVAARRARDPRNPPEWWLVDVEGGERFGPFEGEDACKDAVRERGFDLPRLTPLETLR